MLKVLVKKKLNEDQATPATPAPAAPAQAAPAAPAAPAQQATPAPAAAPAQQQTQQPADQQQQAPQLDAKAYTDAVTAFSDSVAKQIQAACTQEALANAIPQLVNAGKIETFKAQIDAINKSMGEIKSAQSAQDIITKYGELLTALNGLSKAATDAAPTADANTQQPAAQPAAQPAQ